MKTNGSNTKGSSTKGSNTKGSNTNGLISSLPGRSQKEQILRGFNPRVCPQVSHTQVYTIPIHDILIMD